MPPTPKIIVPNGNAKDLIPDPDEGYDPTGMTIAGLKVVKAKDQKRDAFNAMFYAYPGVGKTSVAGMFAAYPPAREILQIDVEGGASVLAHLDYVDVLSVYSWLEAVKVLTWLEREPIDRLKYRTVCLDNITELHRMLIKHVSGGGKVEIQHHGTALTELLSYVQKLRDLSRRRGINTVIMAWQETKENKATGLSRETIALTDKLSTRLPGIPNNVGHITIMNNPPLYTRKLSFQGTPLNDAKLRRAKGDATSPIPLDIYYGVDDNPIADMLATIYDGTPWPTDKYLRPTRAKKANNEVETVAGTAESTES